MGMPGKSALSTNAGTIVDCERQIGNELRPQYLAQELAWYPVLLGVGSGEQGRRAGWVRGALVEKEGRKPRPVLSPGSLGPEGDGASQRAPCPNTGSRTCATGGALAK